jgi:hypothetical protein
MAKGAVKNRSLTQWQRPEYLDTWNRLDFNVEEYAFKTPLIQKHRDVQFWAGNQIGFLTQAAIEELVSRGRSEEEAIDALKKNLREHFRQDAEAFLRQHPLDDKDRHARTIASLVMRWEAALGVAGETMVNTPERFVRRFYDPGDWYRFATPGVVRVMREGEGEGVCLAVNPKFTFRMTRISAGGDPFDEWTVERRDGDSSRSR